MVFVLTYGTRVLGVFTTRPKATAAITRMATFLDEAGVELDAGHDFDIRTVPLDEAFWDR